MAKAITRMPRIATSTNPTISSPPMVFPLPPGRGDALVGDVLVGDVLVGDVLVGDVLVGDVLVGDVLVGDVLV